MEVGVYFWISSGSFLVILVVAGLGGIHFLLHILLPLHTWPQTLGRAGAFAGSILILGVLVEVLKRARTGCQGFHGQRPAPAFNGSDDIDENPPRSADIVSL